jgi:hypothetical protein
LDGFEKAYRKQGKGVVADAGYGSEENYEMLENKPKLRNSLFISLTLLASLANFIL